MKAKTIESRTSTKTITVDPIVSMFERAFEHVKKGNIIVLHKPTK